MTAREILLVAGKELRETLRDRRTLAVMVLFPLVVYPLVSLITAQVMADRATRQEASVSRVAVNGPPALADTVRARLAERRELQLGPPAPRADIGTERVDAIVELEPGAKGKPTARILFDETRSSSRAAQERVAQALGGLAACAPTFAVLTESVAPRASVGGYVLSRILPLIVVVMVMLGAFHPAIDITAGERERSTLETTLSAPIERTALMAGKVLAVATLASITGFLNLASMSLTVLAGAHMVTERLQEMPFALPWLRAAAVLIVVPPAAFLFASVMVAMGALSRSFKEAQTLLMPVYFLCMAPSLIAALGDFPMTATTAAIPGVGLTLLARELVLGHAPIGPALITFATTIGAGAVAMVLAARLYDSERLLGGDDRGMPLSAWLRHLIGGPRAVATISTAEETTAGHALTLYAIACVLLFFVFVPLQAWRLGPGLVISEWVGLFGLTAIYARGSGRRLGTVLRFRLPPGSTLVGALLIGLSGWIFVGLLADWIFPAPKELVDKLRRVIAPTVGDRGLAATLLLMAVTPAVCEEALFRGPILRGLRARLSPATAAILTGAMFGLYHGDVWRFLPTALLGVALSALALASGSIIPSMVAHFVNNACLVLLARAGRDEVGTTLSVGTRLALIAGAGLILASGFWLVRKRPPSFGPSAIP
jgi:sodium transport system permease protein